MLRKSLEVKEFHRFLVSETEVGNISRQELVSMIPVLLLDVKPSQYVLDMCASPGSKTAQLLEALHGKEGKFPDGLVIANDSDQSRCYTLVHQAKRLQSPCLIVTNHNAQTFPRLSPADHPSDALQFDRILCDVPCSGDGTLRKNPMIWRKWTPSDGNSLHKLQCQILHRGCELLKIGGRLVYSTCSFNPLENEAVIASILKESDGALRLVDVSDQLPSLIRYPGMKTWKVANKATDFFSTHAESDGAFLESMFPPANAESLGLEKAVRIYPFSQNSGGFFVACFEKVGAFGGIDRKSEWRLDSAGSTMKEEDSHVIKKQKVEQDTILKGNKESPFVFLPDDNPVLKKCRYTLPYLVKIMD